jgi:hypothetical protein
MRFLILFFTREAYPLSMPAQTFRRRHRRCNGAFYPHPTRSHSSRAVQVHVAGVRCFCASEKCVVDPPRAQTLATWHSSWIGPSKTSIPWLTCPGIFPPAILFEYQNRTGHTKKTPAGLSVSVGHFLPQKKISWER